MLQFSVEGRCFSVVRATEGGYSYHLARSASHRLDLRTCVCVCVWARVLQCGGDDG